LYGLYSNSILCGHVYIIRGKKIKAALIWIFEAKKRMASDLFIELLDFKKWF